MLASHDIRLFSDCALSDWGIAIFGEFTPIGVEMLLCRLHLIIQNGFT